MKQTFLTKYFNATTAQIAGDEQTSLSAALYMNLVNDADRSRVFDRLTAKIAARNNHLDTGVLGTKFLSPVLTDAGRADLFYRIATQTDIPSWGRWIQSGATTPGRRDYGDRTTTSSGDIVTWFYAGSRASTRPTAGLFPDLFRAASRGRSCVGQGGETRVALASSRSAWRLDAGNPV